MTESVFLLVVVSLTAPFSTWGPAHTTLAGAQAACPIQATWSERARDNWDTLRVWQVEGRLGALTFWIAEVPVTD